MRDHDEQDPKKPHPVPRPRKKGMNQPEASEALPWHAIKDGDRDRHRHV
jgi:hypothetical protein